MDFAQIRLPAFIGFADRPFWSRKETRGPEFLAQNLLLKPGSNGSRALRRSLSLDRERKRIMKKPSRTQLLIPLCTGLLALVFIVVGIGSYGFWEDTPTPGFFPIIIAVVLLASSAACFWQVLKAKDGKEVRYNLQELMVILGAGAVIVGTFLIGLVPSVLLYILVWLKLVEKAPWKTVIIIELIVAAIVLGVFTAWLQVRFPVGLLGEMLL